MRDTKKILTLLIFPIFLIAAAFTGCSDPVVGSLAYSVDYIKAVPNKYIYGKNDKFIPARDVKVIGVFGGVEDSIDINNVNIKVVDPLSYIDPILIGNNQNGEPLDTEGVRHIVISYQNLETHYGISIGAPGTGDFTWGDGGASITINYW